MTGVLAICASGGRGAAAINPIPITSLGDDEVGTTASAALTLLSDGTIQVLGNTSSAGPNWAVTPMAFVGDYFWVRLTVTAGMSPGTGTVGSWLSLTAGQSWSWTQSLAGSTTATITVQLATDSGGSNIVASVTGVAVSVVRT